MQIFNTSSIKEYGYDIKKTSGEMKTVFRDVKEEVGKGSAEVKNKTHLLRDDFRELFIEGNCCSYRGALG